jgi:NO-binding membrane sensor protein with MHYT domain
MAELDHFTYGWINPALAYGMSFLGSLLGLLCTARARKARQAGRHVRWLVLAAVAIGGAGIWVMHFLAMLGFTVNGSDIRYDPGMTLASALAAVGVVGVGLFIVGNGEPSVLKVLSGGLFTGLGVATMHYMGMEAMRVHGEIGYDTWLVVASVAIAVVAATVALWFTVVVESAPAITLAALIMGVAVCGMHYTAMAALQVRMTHADSRLGGIDPFGFLAPIVLLVGIALVMVLFTVLTQEDRVAEVSSDRSRVLR